VIAVDVAPQNLEAEELVLGAILLGRSKTIEAVERVLGNGVSFYRESHAVLYRAALSLRQRGAPTDPVSVIAELERSGRLGDVEGGQARVYELANLAPAAGNAAHYAQLVLEASHRRAEWLAAFQLAHASANGGLAGSPDLRLTLEALLHQATAGAARDRLVSGGQFVLDAPEQPPAVWGGASGSLVWASGEGLMICGPDGVGKTTVAQQLTLGLLGLRERVLDMRVATVDGRVLYIAADRPAQAARSFRRMVSPDDREVLDERLVVWRGPLPFSVVDEPASLARFAENHAVGAVIVDSLKDLAPALGKDEVGGGVNLAFQEVLARGIELAALHHQKKEQAGQAPPKKLADVYGSRWLTAGMGSVVLLWGNPGDLIVEFSHLKQPADEVGPFKLLHDHDRGETRIVEQVDLLEVVMAAGGEGLTVHAAAGFWFDTATPDPNQVEKVRRRLEKLVTSRFLTRHGEKPNPITYRKAS
jgi:replicative DNA helicase